MTLDTILQQLDITSDDYHKALSISTKGRALILQRRLCDMNVNNYNPAGLLAWQANMDVQPVLDPYACIMYIVSYITKDEREMGELLKAAKKEHSDKDVKTQLKKIGSVFLTHREVSAQEAVFRLLSLPMLSCNIKRVFVPTDMPDKRVRILKSRKLLEMLDPDSEDVFMSGIIQRYSARPSSLDEMCLADFAVEYDTCYKNNSGTPDDDSDVQPATNEGAIYDKIITLQNGMGKMRHRKTRSVLLMHRFSQEKEPEKFYHAELMMFIPWRDEEIDLLHGFSSYSDAHADKSHEIIAVKKKFQPNGDNLAEAVEYFFDNGPPQAAWDRIAGEQCQEKSDCVQEGVVEETFVDCADDVILTTTFVDNISQPQPISAPIDRQQKAIPDDSYYSMIQSLNTCQQQLFQFVLDWCRTKRLCDTTAPFHIFCTGGAGVGKSHLINAVVQMANRELRRVGDNPDDILIHLSAPTGTASYNIQGSTIHSSFQISVSNHNKANSLSAEKLANLRQKFSHLKILIIDELSMVGANLFVSIHERLVAISGLPVSTPFANVSILAVGDFQQLSPVYESPVYKSPKDPYYALANLWESNFFLFELTEIMRQRGDSTFAELLGRLRIGLQTNEDIKLLQSRIISRDDPSISQIPRIFSLNADVDSYNNQQLDILPSALLTFLAQDRMPNECKGLKFEDDGKKSGLPTVLNLKTGARVILIRNIDTESGLFNGALGTVTGFLPPSTPLPTSVLVLFDNKDLRKLAQQKHPRFNGAFPIERFESRFPINPRRGNKFVEATRLQFPLKVAFSLTIHKCQGQTLDAVVVSLKGYFGPGQAYVAMSRCKTLEGLHFTQFDSKCIKVNQSGLRALQSMKQERPLPVPHNIWLQATSVIRLALLNTRSLEKHVETIISNIYMAASDIAVFTESRLNKDSPPLLFQHWTVFLANAPVQHNYVGGVAILTRSNIHAQLLTTVIHNKFQLLAVKICTPETFRLVAVYKSPSMPVSEFRPILHHQIQKFLEQSVEPMLVIGDFNTNALEETLLNYPQRVTEATHVHGAILDHVYWTGEQSHIVTDVITCPWSDHNIVTIAIGTPKPVLPHVPSSSQSSFSSVKQSKSHAKSKSPPEKVILSPTSMKASKVPTEDSEYGIITIKIPTSTDIISCSRNTRHTQNVAAVCQFLDGALGTNLQLDLGVPIDDIIRQHHLKIRPAPPNGHCLLHAWAAATNVSVEVVKRVVIQEFTQNSARYMNASIDPRQLQSYISSRTYRLDAVDAVVDILCNATGIAAFVIGPKYDYTNPRHIKMIPNVTEIRRITSSSASPNRILLLKTMEHYDSFV